MSSDPDINDLRRDIAEARKDMREGFAAIHGLLREQNGRIGKTEIAGAVLTEKIGPVEKLVYGLVGVVVLGVLTAMLSSVMMSPAK